MHEDEHRVANEDEPTPAFGALARNGRLHHDDTKRSTWSADRDAEADLLGAMLRGADPDLVDLAAWTIEGAQAVHYALAQLHDTNSGGPDLALVAATVGAELDRLTIDADGIRTTGRAALVSLYARAPSTSAAPKLADVVNEHHRLRVVTAALSRAEAAVRGRDLQAVDDALASITAERTSAPNTSSWHTIDLAPIITGDSPSQPPTILHRVDGQALLYTGKVNAFSAESETAKTWLALWACAEEIDAGNNVVFIDFEDTAHTAVERLLAFNLEADQILEHFHYLRPDDPIDRAARAAIEKLLADTAATLAVIDGVTEVMNLNGLSLLDNDDIATFYRLLPRHIAASGAATLNIDHVPKDVNNRKGGIGGQHKRAGLDGAAYKLEPMKPFGRGLHGAARLVVDKDRAGHVRGASLGGTVAGELHLDSTSGHAHLTISAPDTTRGQGTWDGPTQCMDALRVFFATTDEEISQRQVPDRLAAASGHSWRAKTIRDGLEHLVVLGVLTARTGPRNARLYRLATPTEEADHGMF